MIRKIDNALPTETFNEISNFITDRNFPWYFHSGTAFADTTDLDESSFFHKILDEGVTSHPFKQQFIDAITLGLNKFNKEPKVYKFHRIQINLTTYRHDMKFFLPHVDMRIPHKVGIFYINDCSGDTIIFKEKYDINSNMHCREYGEVTFRNNFVKLKRVTPKPNRLVVFDGLHYHGGLFTDDAKRRLIININFEELN